jgi:hypothetical protein
MPETERKTTGRLWKIEAYIGQVRPEAVNTSGDRDTMCAVGQIIAKLQVACSVNVNEPVEVLRNMEC